MPAKIAFWDNYLCERGSSVAMFDYAYFNMHLLGNESFIFYGAPDQRNNEDVVRKFNAEFDVVEGISFEQIHDRLRHYGCTHLFTTKYGTSDDGRWTPACKNLFLCNFVCYDPHGDVYASVSRILPGWNPHIPIVPHMIHLDKTVTTDMRDELGIPRDAVVFGRHGGPGEFDIIEVQQIVLQVALMNPDIYFLFMNTNPFCPSLPNIIHIPAEIGLKRKTEFINTCDAMIWARYRGETFGLSIGEFSTQNKPVICKVTGQEDAHIELLGDKCILYTLETLYDILTTFDRDAAKTRDWNAYRDYEPEKVMQIFRQVYGV